MPDREREPSYRWPSDRPGNRRSGSNRGMGSGGRPLFGVADSGRWVAFASVVSASVGLLVLPGAAMGFALGSGAGLKGIVTLSVLAGIVGILLGTRLALRLTDVEKTRPHLIRSAVGGIIGLAVGAIFPTMIGFGLTPMTPILAIAGPGIGAVTGLVAPARWKAWKKKRAGRTHGH